MNPVLLDTCIRISRLAPNHGFNYFLDMRRDVQEIFRNTPHEKQVMMFSATLSKEIRPVCKKFMQDVITTAFVLFLLRYINTTSFVLSRCQPSRMDGWYTFLGANPACLAATAGSLKTTGKRERDRSWPKVTPLRSFHLPSTLSLPLPSAPPLYHQLLSF